MVNKFDIVHTYVNSIFNSVEDSEEKRVAYIHSSTQTTWVPTRSLLHIYLFPRYLDDEFPSSPIDYRLTEPAPYESYKEYMWFVEQMRKELQHA